MALASAMAYSRSTVDDPFTDAQASVTLDPTIGTGPNGGPAPAVVVAFRGSSSARDFLQDAEFWFTELVRRDYQVIAEVHHGFLEDFNAISVAVVLQVRALLAQYPAAGIYITGHSLGGALAILCALEFSRLKLAVTQVTTFGGPRVGNAAFRALYDAAPVTGHSSPVNLHDITFRVVNQNDIVPRTPGWLMGYRHVGQEIFLEPVTGWGVNPSLGYKVLCDVLGLWGAYRRRSDVLISQHFISSYERRIQLLS